jgi:hypothetical protein
MGPTAYTEPQCLYKRALYRFYVEDIKFCQVDLFIRYQFIIFKAAQLIFKQRRFSGMTPNVEMSGVM